MAFSNFEERRWLTNCWSLTNRWQIIKRLRAHKRKQKCDMKASCTADPGATSPLHHRYVSWDIIQALSTLETKTEYLSYLQFGVPPRGERGRKQARGHCVTTEKGIFLLCFRSRLVWGWPNYFFSLSLSLHPLSPGSTSVDSFSRRVSPRGLQSGSPTLLRPQRCLKILCHAKFTAEKKRKRKSRQTTFPWTKWLEENNQKWAPGASRWKNIHFKSCVSDQK